MTLSSLKRIGSTHKRKIIVITSIVIVVLAIAAYALWSVNVWSVYKTSYENWQKELKTSINAAIALPGKTPAERSKKRVAFKDVSDKISAAQESLCRTPSLVTWQHAISSLREREEACGQVLGGAETFGKKMQTTITYLDNEQALATALATAITASEGKVTEDTWGSQTGTWLSASKAITGISSTDTSFKVVKTSALEKVASIQAAWSDLITAHSAKDKAKYLEAQGKLAVAYEALPSLSTTSAEQLTGLATSLQTSYSQVFGSNT
jgi:hypothetical protein